MKPRILYTKPSITELEVKYATDAAANGWGDQCYAYINRFEGLERMQIFNVTGKVEQSGIFVGEYECMNSRIFQIPITDSGVYN